MKKKALYPTVLIFVSVRGSSIRKVTYSSALNTSLHLTYFLAGVTCLTGKAEKETKPTSPATLFKHLNSMLVHMVGYYGVGSFFAVACSFETKLLQKRADQKTYLPAFSNQL